MSRIRLTSGVVALALAGVMAAPLQGQDWTQREFPLAPTNASGNFVAPYFDGYYRNDDGTYTLSFGFMNRNDSELIEIPVGPYNYIEPAQYDGIQPTSFPTVSYGGFGGPRERGSFGVVVPADFRGEVRWHLTTDGYHTSVPGRLVGPGQIITFSSAYELSTTPQARGSLRPLVQWSENGPGVWGLAGTYHPQTFRTRVGQPIEVTLWAFDRGERDLQDVNLTLWKHQGPVGGQITFMSLVEGQPASGGGGFGGRGGGRGGGGGGGGAAAEPEPEPQGPTPVNIGQSIRLPTEGQFANQGRFTASFDMPGEYVIRTRIDNFTSGDSGAGNQCCWSNSYVRVVVTQ